MDAKRRKRAVCFSIVGVLVVGAAVTSLLVMASNDITFTASAYSDVIRFTADGVGSLQIRIYDMTENELWDSGQVWMDFVDWDRSNEWGERLANGYYIYFVQAWSNADGMNYTLPYDAWEVKGFARLWKTALYRFQEWSGICTF